LRRGRGGEQNCCKKQMGNLRNYGNCLPLGFLVSFGGRVSCGVFSRGIGIRSVSFLQGNIPLPRNSRTPALVGARASGDGFLIEVAELSFSGLAVHLAVCQVSCVVVQDVLAYLSSELALSILWKASKFCISWRMSLVFRPICVLFLCELFLGEM